MKREAINEKIFITINRGFAGMFSPWTFKLKTNK